jgi:hypothetical protein
MFCRSNKSRIWIGKIVTPGLSGTATFIILLILWLKGYKAVGMDAFDMPSNWFSLHPIQKEKGLNKVIQKTNGKAYRVFDKIISGKTHWLHGNFFYELISGLILFPISFLYLCVGRFFLG